jgi:hypothetical protein
MRLTRRQFALGAGFAVATTRAEGAAMPPVGPFATPEALDRSLAESDVSPADRSMLLALAKPAAALQSKAALDAAIPVGASKIGGDPDLPHGMVWPQRPPSGTGKANVAMLRGMAATQPSAYLERELRLKAPLADRPAPLTFMLQVDLAACAATGPLDPDIPRTGHFLVFYDSVFHPWTGRDADGTPMFQLLHIPAGADLERQSSPDLGYPLFGEDYPDLRDRLPPARLSPLFTYTLPDLYSEPIFSRYIRAPEFPHQNWLYTGPTHLDANNRLGGWPENIQHDMAVELAAEAQGISLPEDALYVAASHAMEPRAQEWVMLLQIGNYDNTVNDFDGLYYVWINRRDLRAGDFTKARMLYQTS